MNAQWGAVRPTGLRKKPRYLDALRSRYGQATQQVVATKQKEQQQAETQFNQDQQKKSLALQQQQFEEQKKQAKRSETLGYANTGLNLFKTIMSFF